MYFNINESTCTLYIVHCTLYIVHVYLDDVWSGIDTFDVMQV